MTQRGRSTVSVRDLLVAGLLREGQQLRFSRANEQIAVLDSNGGLRVGDQSYRSPSSAARALNGGVAVNGWTAWRLADSDGVSLAEVRRRFLSSQLANPNPL